MAKYLRKPKLNIPMYAAAVLFCLTVISTYMVSGLYARYTTSGTGEDSARVIKFGELSITETGDFVTDTKNMMIIPGVDIYKKAVVSFEGSEAATYVFVEVALAGGWSYANGTFTNGGMSWQIADGWTYLTNSDTDSIYVFYRALAPNTALTDVDILKVITEETDTNGDGKTTYSIKVSDSITKSTIDALASSITFRASVVQSHGFDNVEAAWTSLRDKEGAGA